MPPKSTNNKSVSAPVSKQKITRITRRAQNKQPFLVKEKEFIGDLAGSVSFSNTQFAINPGLFASFPWLSQIAKNYESYSIRKLRVLYETETSTALAGSVMMAFDYDSADAAPVDKTQIMSYADAVRGPVWSAFDLQFRPPSASALGEKRYIRSASLSSNLDIKTYDVAVLNVATKGMADTALVGELYLEYEIEFFTPQLGNGVGVCAQYSATSPDDATPLGSALTAAAGSNAILTWTTATTATVKRSGQFLIHLQIIGTTVTGIGAVSNSGTALTSVSASFAPGGTSADRIYLANLVAGDVLTFSANTSATQTAAYIRLASYLVSLL